MRRSNRPADAVRAFAEASALLPDEATPHLLIAEVFRELKRFGEAAIALEQARVLRPDDVKTLRLLADSLYQNQDIAGALAAVERLRVLTPDVLKVYTLQATLLRQLNRPAEAAEVCNDALARFPDDVSMHLYAAGLYKYELGDFTQASEHYRRAIALNPGDLQVQAIYAECVSNDRKGDEGANFELGYRAAKTALATGTPTPEQAGYLQGVLLRACDFEAFEQLGDANTLLGYWGETGQPGRFHHRMSRVRTLQDRHDLLNAHRDWGRTIETPQRTPPARGRKSNDKIRMAFVSSDLRNHPVTYFVHPLLELYDRERFEVFCYSFWPKPADDVQQHLSRITDRFTVLTGMDDAAIAARIAADAPDILFELGGTTHMNRAEMLAHRPAPIQVSWLGYPHSLGLSSVDRLLVDPFLCPAPELMCEQPFMLPESWVTLGRLGFYDLEIDPQLPQIRNGHLTFGSMNQPYKYTDALFDAWAEILRAVPKSQFLFVRPEGSAPGFRENIGDHFERRGVARDRIAFRAVRGKHMQHYNDIDISLDTFPHTGGTTTCETLWMGVPVVTLVGQAFFERISYSNLCNAGLPDLCAFDAAEYVSIAVELAENQQRRQALRGALRAQIAAHPLGQGTRFVRAFEQAAAAAVGSEVLIAQ